MTKNIALILTLVLGLVVAGCGKSGDKEAAKPGTEEKAKAGEEKAAGEEKKAGEEKAGEEKKAEAPAAGETVVEIAANDQMQFDKKEITVPAGGKVKLTLKHTGKLAKGSMGHNFVILKSGVDMAAFSTAAMAAKDTDYIPADKKGDIVAATKLIGGGESDTITFDAPAAGTYDFLCTFPGHFALMKGKFIVK